MPLAHFSRVGRSGNRTPDLLRSRPERIPLHHQPIYGLGILVGFSVMVSGFVGIRNEGQKIHVT